MKLTLSFLALFSLVVISQAAPRSFFTEDGWSGVIDAFGKIEGVDTKDDERISSKAEEKIKALIGKHLLAKKMNKNQAKGFKAPEVAPAQNDPKQFDIPQAPHIPASLKTLQSVNWEEHKETRDLINEKVPGGIESVNALIKLMQEREQK